MLIQEETASETLLNAYNVLLAEADFLLTTKPFSVTEKSIAPHGGSVHDFHTLSPFFWPNGIIPGGRPYIYRDGQKNPEVDSDRYDRVRLSRFTHTVQILSLAYYFTGNNK